MLKWIEDYKKIREERNKDFDFMLEETRKIREKIEVRKKQIERLEKKLENQENLYYKKDYPSWIETIVEPLMHELEEKTGLYGEIYGPFGICSKTSIYLRKDMDKSITEQPTLEITVEPPNKDGSMYYETGETKGGYAKGSIGEMNGMNKVMAKLPDNIEEIIELLRGDKELLV